DGCGRLLQQRVGLTLQASQRALVANVGDVGNRAAVVVEAVEAPPEAVVQHADEGVVAESHRLVAVLGEQLGQGGDVIGQLLKGLRCLVYSRVQARKQRAVRGNSPGGGGDAPVKYRCLFGEFSKQRRCVLVIAVHRHAFDAVCIKDEHNNIQFLVSHISIPVGA